VQSTFLAAQFSTSRSLSQTTAHYKCFHSLTPMQHGDVPGMHATPESSGLNQSPLAAEPTCARHPHIVGTIHSEERNGCRDTNRANSAPLRPRIVNLFAASASRSNSFQPRGSWAPLMGLSEHVTRAQLHGLRGKQSTPDRWGRSEPPEQSSGSQARCRALSSEESRASVILLTNPDRETRAAR